MPRIRYLKPDFFRDEDLADLPYWIRLLYAGLWVLADKEGRLEDRPKRIKVELFPYDKVDIGAGLLSLTKPKASSGKPFILRYVVEGQGVIQILEWHKHQRPHHTERDSGIPEPPKSALTVKPPLPNGGKPLEKGMEKGMEKEKDASTVPTASFLKALKTNPAYRHIDIDIESAKMDAWLLTKPGRKKTKRFIVNWLNRIDPGMKVQPPKLRSPIGAYKQPAGRRHDPKVAKMVSETAAKMKGGK